MFFASVEMSTTNIFTFRLDAQRQQETAVMLFLSLFGKKSHIFQKKQKRKK